MTEEAKTEPVDVSEEFVELQRRLNERYEWADANRLYAIADAQLLACPFCGETDGLRVIVGRAHCLSCGAAGPKPVEPFFGAFSDCRSAGGDHRNWREVCASVEAWNARAARAGGPNP